MKQVFGCPAPSAMIVSPSAMMMTEPWRSMKYEGTTRSPFVPASRGLPKSTAAAAIHSNSR